MQTKFISFHDQANRLITDVLARSNILAAAIGRAVANVQPLPSSPVESASGYFNTHALPQLRTIVSEWNENMTVNTAICTEYARIFWLLRYNAAHPNSRPLYDSPYDFFCTTMGVKSYVSDEQYAFLNTHKETILALSSSVSRMLCAEQEQRNG